MLKDHLLSSLLQCFGSAAQPFPLLGERSVRRPRQSNAAWAACCAFGWSTSPGLEVVFGMLRAGKQVSDKEHHFSSWREPKRSSLSGAILPFSRPVPASAVGIFPHPSVERVSKLQDMLILGSGSFLFIRPHQASAASTRELAPPVRFEAAQTTAASCCGWLGSPPPVSTSNASQLTLKETSQNPSYPRSSLQRAWLANGKQLQSLMLSQGIWALAVKVPGSDPVDRL